MNEVESDDADVDTAKPKRSWSLNYWGNRLVFCIFAGFVVNVSTGTNALGTVIAVVLFVLTTAIVHARNR
jgi:hypothetical protein